MAYLEGSQLFGDIINDNISLSEDGKSLFRSYFGCILVDNDIHKS